MSENNELGILEQRRIEAEIIKPIYDVLVREVGIQKARDVIEEAIGQSAIDAGKAFASKEAGQTSIESFAALQYLWEKGNALEIEVISKDETKYEYQVKRCKYAEMYHEVGLGEIGFLLSCNRDAKFIEGYAPHIALTRPNTIMNGNGFCDFCYEVKPSSN